MPAVKRTITGSRSSFNPTDETNNNSNNVNEKRDQASASYEVRPDSMTYDEILAIPPEIGRIVYDVTNETERYYDGSSWQSMSGTSSQVGQRAANYDSLTNGSTIGELAYVNQPQGTQWLPYTIGGTYYPQGWYIWDGSVWTSDRNSIVNQLQLNVDGLGGKANIEDIRTDAEINSLIEEGTLGFVTEDTNLSDSDIAAMGYIKTYEDTQRTDAEIQTVIDTNTAGFVTTDTQLTDAEIAEFGYVKTDTQLTDQEIADFGYIKEGGSDQITDAEISELGYIKADEGVGFAKGGSLALAEANLAAAGQPALNTLCVGAVMSSADSPTNGKVQGISLGNGNVIEVFDSGSDYNNNIVLYREFMQLGEPICFTGINQGAIITSTQGFYGFAEQISGSHESPMPLMTLGLAFTSTFVYAFRNSNGISVDKGIIYITCGALPSKVTLARGNGTVVNGQENIELDAFESVELYTNGNTEFLITATSPVMGCIQARMGNRAAESRFYDARLIMPTTNDGITWPRSGNVSAPYNNTVVDYYVRDGATGSFTVSPSAWVDFDGTTGATDSDYEPNGATRVLAKGLISAYSGADSAGLEASPLMPTSAMSQIVAQPLFIDDSGDGGNSGVAIASPYEGTAKVYQWNDVTKVADLAYTVPLTKGSGGSGIPLTSPIDQNFPASGLIANEPAFPNDPSVILLDGDLGAGYVIADVPITVVVQNALPTFKPEVRSQNGTVTESIVNDDDETLSLGWTPSDVRAELTRDAGGYLVKRVIDETGVMSFVRT